MTVLSRMMLAALAIVLASVAAAAEPHDREGHDHPAPSSKTPADLRQTICPVMVGNKIDPNIHSVYKGEKVYFCCSSCKAKFDAAPEKYLDRLPQFASAEPEHEHGAAWARLVRPLGITTLALVLLTAGAGRFRRLKPRVLLKCHKALALATVVAALCHATLVFLFH